MFKYNDKHQQKTNANLEAKHSVNNVFTLFRLELSDLRLACDAKCRCIACMQTLFSHLIDIKLLLFPYVQEKLHYFHDINKYIFSNHAFAQFLSAIWMWHHYICSSKSVNCKALDITFDKYIILRAVHVKHINQKKHSNLAYNITRYQLFFLFD